MSTALKSVPGQPQTIADLIAQLGGIPPQRIRLRPWPGTATEADVITVRDREDRLCELVDGVLVEKTVGFYESLLGGFLLHLLWDFLEKKDLGIAAAADGTVKLRFALVRIPDVSFVSWNKLPNREIPQEAIPNLVPDLAVEIISKGNTVHEMERKLREYFEAGVGLVWYVYPGTRTVKVYTAVDRATELHETDTLDGGSVLPGFVLPLKKLFGKVPHRQPAVRLKKRDKSTDSTKPGRKSRGR